MLQSRNVTDVIFYMDIMPAIDMVNMVNIDTLYEKRVSTLKLR